MKKVLITGVQGQDGSILAEKHLERGDKVVGLDLWQPSGNYPNLHDAVKNPNFALESGDISEQEFVYQLLMKYQPDVIYNMAAISMVPESFKIPKRVIDVNTGAVVNFLETIRHHIPDTRFYQASTSEQIGYNKESPQNTESMMLPNSPYAVAKLASYHFVRLYRTAYNIFATNGMLWNHEGPRRGLNFVTRKISHGVASISEGLIEKITLGNLDAYRDWGSADDYCDAMILMMEADEPDDYAVNTGESHSVREFVEEAFNCINKPIHWEGDGLEEKGIDQEGYERVAINPKYYRPNEVEYLCGDYSKIKDKLGWEPKTTFYDLVGIMVDHDLKGLRDN